MQRLTICALCNLSYWQASIHNPTMNIKPSCIPLYDVYSTLMCPILWTVDLHSLPCFVRQQTGASETRPNSLRPRVKPRDALCGFSWFLTLYNSTAPYGNLPHTVEVGQQKQTLPVKNYWRWCLVYSTSENAHQGGICFHQRIHDTWGKHNTCGTLLS
jgi:hypothetical protein